MRKTNMKKKEKNDNKHNTKFQNGPNNYIVQGK